MNTYLPGAMVLLSVTITASNTPIDPTTVSLIVRSPTGTETTYTGGQLTHPEIGVYSYALDTTNAPSGVWWYRWAGVGAGGQGAGEQPFYIKPSAF